MGTPAGVPVLGVAAPSGTGKTTLLVRLLPLLKAGGLRVGLIKRAHHDFEVDTPGKDSFRLRKAGAERTLVASPWRWALMAETEPPRELSLDELLARLDPQDLDLVLVEGLKHEPIPKIEVFRPALGLTPLYPSDPAIVAIATDGVPPVPTALPVLGLNAPGAVASFVVQWAKGAAARP